MNEELVIVGAGGFGREVLDWARGGSPAWQVRGFVDDNLAALERFSRDVGVISTVDQYAPAGGDRVVCAIGRVDFKRRCVAALRAAHAQFGRVIHASAVVGSNARLGEGVILCPHAVISPDVELGDFVTVNLHSTVAHDARVGAFTQIHCHVDVTGGVEIGEGVLIGSHASILPGIKIGEGAIIGAGSVVTRDVPAGATMFGVPARVHALRGEST